MADARLESYYQRRLRLEKDKREITEDIKDLNKEMKGVGILPAEMKGIDIRVARDFKSDDKRALEIEANEVADSLGQLATTPLGNAAVERAREYAV